MTESQTVMVHSLTLGDIEVPEASVIDFREGLPGFPYLRRFALLEKEELKPFQYLQALDDPPIALLVVNPTVVQTGYRPQLTGSDLDRLRAVDLSELAVYAVATIPEDPRESTLNLMAPIVIHEKEKLGRQVILHQKGYSVRHPLFDASRGSEPGRQ